MMIETIASYRIGTIKSVLILWYGNIHSIMFLSLREYHDVVMGDMAVAVAMAMAMTMVSSIRNAFQMA